MESQIIAKAREINNYKSFWCAEKVNTARLEFQLKFGRKASVAIMGLAFKPNIDDLRESPASYIAQRILRDSQDNTCYVVEPNIKQHDFFKLTHFLEAIDKADIIVFLVAHSQFRDLKIDNSKRVIDFCGITN